MTKKDVISYFKKGKTVQLCAMILILAAFLIETVANDTFRNNLYANKTLFTMSLFFWLLLIVCFVCILIDFVKLNRFDAMEEKYEIMEYMEQSKGMLNRFSCDNLFQSDEMVQKVLAKVGCAMIEIDNLIAINKEKGRDAGDHAIEEFCRILEEIGNDYGITVRNGGNEFLIVISDCTPELMQKCLEELDNSVALYNEAIGPDPLSIHSTYVLNDEKHFDRFSEILTLAYKQLHTA